MYVQYNMVIINFMHQIKESFESKLTMSMKFGL